MKLYRWAQLLTFSALALCQCDSQQNYMKDHQSDTTAEQQAEQRLKQHIDSIALFRDASIARLPELDIAGYFAFSMMPKATGRAGEVTYMVNEQEILSSGQPTHFDRIMKKVMAHGGKVPLDVNTFAGLFLRMKAIRSGVVLDKPERHVLMKPNQLPPEIFESPSVSDKPEGLNYRFWIFDTDRHLPVFWDVWVKADGTTTFSLKEIREINGTG